MRQRRSGSMNRSTARSAAGPLVVSQRSTPSVSSVGARASRRRLGRSSLLAVVATLCMSLCISLGSSTASARDGLRPSPAFDVEIRVIEASNTKKHFIDPKLTMLAPDLKTLPFNDYLLKDHHRVTMKQSKRISFQFPGNEAIGNAKDKRFLVVTAHGEQRGGKLRFQFMIQALKFDTLVAVPNGGTILVGGPRNGDKTLLFAVTARKAASKSRKK